MKQIKFLSLLLILTTAVVFLSCNKDEDDPALNPPTIPTFEFGYEDSGEAYLGADLHIEAEIVADAKIDRIQVSIHPEGEHMKSLSDEHAWEVDTTYTKFNGLKNTEFHEHLDVPVTCRYRPLSFSFSGNRYGRKHQGG
jgi:hypothetical protein